MAGSVEGEGLLGKDPEGEARAARPPRLECREEGGDRDKLKG